MRKRKLKKNVVAILLLVFMGLFCIFTSFVYLYLASPVDKNSDKEIEVEIKSGMRTAQIAKLLEKKKVIRSGNFFLVYAKLNQCEYLKASHYSLKKSMSLNTIFSKICSGDYSRGQVALTFKDGKRITDYAKVISKHTSHSYDSVIALMKDREYIKELISNYWFLTDDILNQDIYYPLEGYLYPDTYQFSGKDVKLQEIIEVMLNETDKKFRPYKEDLEQGSHSIHEYVTLASMAELEGTNSENRKMIVGIFENRLQKQMNLGSDVTTYYALEKAMTSDLTKDEYATKNPYNTRDESKLGLPVGPICSVTAKTLNDSIHPTLSDYYYFVADKNGNIYYTKDVLEHEKKVAELKDAGDWIW